LDFPVHILAPDVSEPIYRITKPEDGEGHAKDVIYFGSSGKGRFDLFAADDRQPGNAGTCYLGTTGIACFVEKFGDLRVIPASEVASNVLATVRPSRELRLADMCDGRVLGRFGLTAETWTSGVYLRPQEWARALYQAGFDGILYGTRHDPAGQLRALAVFGSSSADPLLMESVEPIPEALVQQAFTDYGLIVDEPPPLAGLVRG